MDFDSIEHHSFDNYCYPFSKDKLAINLQTGKDITKIYIIWGDPFSFGIMGGKEKWQGQKTEITKNVELQKFLFWSIEVEPKFKRCRYYFELHAENETYFYCEDGFYSPEQFNAISYQPECFIFPWMNSADICTPPSWVKNTVWYQIFPSRFNRSITANVEQNNHIKPWGASTQKVSNYDEFGGNIKGITEKLDYLADLGVTGLYLNPINKSRSQHKYDTTDYLEVDPSFGTKEEMKTLVKEAHKRNIKIMLDGVFNHSGWDFFAWQDILKNREKSKYADWYMINDFNFPSTPSDSSAKGKFYAFAFCDPMPKFNTNNPELRNYLLNVCETWVKEYDIDALRLDVANEISHLFCKELKERMCSLKKDFYILGEIWHNALPWLRGDEFDGVMNYPLENSILNFITTEKMNAIEFEEEVNRCLTMYFKQTEESLLNQMDSHDTIRLVTKVGSEEKAMQALMILFSMPGSACIYYGTEVMLQGEHDPDCRRCMPWKELDEGKFNTEISFMKELIALRKTHPALCGYNVQFSSESDYKNSFCRIIHIRKTSDDNTETLDVILNFEKKSFKIKNNNKKILFSNKYSNGILGENGFIVY